MKKSAIELIARSFRSDVFRKCVVVTSRTTAMIAKRINILPKFTEWDDIRFFRSWEAGRLRYGLA